MMNVLWRAAAVACVCLLSAGQLAAQSPRERDERRAPEPEAREGQIDLRPRFERGQQVRYRLELKNTSSVMPAGRGAARQHGHPDAHEVEFGLLFDVKDVTREGEATVDLTLESVKLKVETAELTMEFDSTAGGSDDDLTAMVLNSIVGTTMTLTIDRAGNIKRISGGTQLAALGQMGMPGAGGAGGGSPMDLFGSIFSMKHGTGFARIGETWKNEDVIESPLLGRFHMNTEHTLRRMRGRDAIVEMRGRMQQDSAAGHGAGLVKIHESNYSGNYVWDTRAGALTEMNTSMLTRAEATIGDEQVETRNESAVKITRVR